VAREVMERTDHVFLVGRGAKRFARRAGYRPYDPVTARRRKQWEQMMGELAAGKNPPYLPNLSSYGRAQRFGTVGAVAMDRSGHLAAATSTGAMMLRLPGRVGDSPIIGAGTYAHPLGAVSATGHGEEIIKIAWAVRTVDLMRRMSAQKAVEQSIRMATDNGCRGGLIAMDRRGNVGFGFNTRSMSWARADDGGVEVF
jgi:beta-aspartyl-peptidase (threonine type)